MVSLCQKVEDVKVDNVKKKLMMQAQNVKSHNSYTITKATVYSVSSHKRSNIFVDWFGRTFVIFCNIKSDGIKRTKGQSESTQFHSHKLTFYKQAAH